MVLTWLYNDLGAGDENFLVRHFNNALGFVTFGAGAAQVACGEGNSLNATAYVWLGVIVAIITFTIQFQDMEDQEGDRERDRRTLPIVLGDVWTRRLNAFVIAASSIAAPSFWQLGAAGFALPMFLGCTIAVRSILLKSLSADKTTFKLWCLWLIVLYLLPLAKGEGALAALCASWF
jgi:4-hydroxybenzoate polyprenyltransferase